MWNLLLKCYATEAEAITAAKRTTSLILPYMNSPTNIAGSYDVLVELLGEEAARDVCIRNPAVLGNDPAALRGCSAKDIQDSARLKEFFAPRRPAALGDSFRAHRRRWHRDRVDSAGQRVGSDRRAPGNRACQRCVWCRLAAACCRRLAAQRAWHTLQRSCCTGLCGSTRHGRSRCASTLYALPKSYGAPLPWPLAWGEAAVWYAPRRVRHTVTFQITLPHDMQASRVTTPNHRSPLSHVAL